MEIINKEFAPKIEKMTENQIYDKFNENNTNIKFNTLNQLLKSAFEKYADNIAIVDKDIRITYKKLDLFSNKVENYINYMYNSNYHYIILKARRNWKTIGIIIGILKAGKAYVPVQENIPEERLQFIQSATKCQVVLDSDVDFEEQSENADVKNVEPDDCAYVIFTSGSTGEPKGVRIPHVSAAVTMQSVNRLFGLNEFDAVIGVSALTFDLSVFDLFGTLSAGARLVLAEDNKNLPLLEQIIQKEKVTTINAVPSIVKMIMEYTLKLQGEASSLYSLRNIILSGDVVPEKTVDTILENLPETNLHIMGGPTEITVWSNDYLYKEQRKVLSYIPYGRSISNKTLYIEKDGKKVVETEGEIISGEYGLALDYMDNQELTREKFFIWENERVYRTGDRGILTADGEIEILGRVDNQVKVNGYRVELEEIERCINSIEEVSQSVVCMIRKEDEDRIVAGVQMKQELSEESIRDFLLKKLLSYQIPKDFIFLEKLPLSENNKVDRKRFKQFILEEKV